MYNIVLFIHIIISIFLIVIILIQRGRGGGLVEALAGAESLFGTKTSSFLVKMTTTLAIIFFITSTSLAFLSKQRGRSILEKTPLLEEKPKKSQTEKAEQKLPESSNKETKKNSNIKTSPKQKASSTQ